MLPPPPDSLARISQDELVTYIAFRNFLADHQRRFDQMTNGIAERIEAGADIEAGPLRAEPETRNSGDSAPRGACVAWRRTELLVY